MADDLRTPWKLAASGRSILTKGGAKIIVPFSPNPYTLAEQNEFLQRIVACVNHCDGFDTDTVSAGPDMAELTQGWCEAERLRATQATLLAALVVAESRMLQALAIRIKLTGITTGAIADELKQIQAAIAAAKEKSNE